MTPLSTFMASFSLTDWLIPLALGLLPVVMRSIGLAWTAPGWGMPGLSWRIRLGLAATLSLIVAPSVGSRFVGNLPTGSGWFSWIGSSVVELAMGAALGYSAALVVSAARQAGDLIGAQAGLSVASLLDPESGEGATALGHLYGLMALAMFLAHRWPSGSGRGTRGQLSSDSSRDQLGIAHPGSRGSESSDASDGLYPWPCATAPAALAVALAGLAIGWIARSAGASPLGGMVWPVRSAVGVVVVWLGLGSVALWVSGAWAEWLSMVQGLL